MKEFEQRFFTALFFLLTILAVFEAVVSYPNLSFHGITGELPWPLLLLEVPLFGWLALYWHRRGVDSQ